MKYLSIGALVPGRSRVVVEAWALDADGATWLTLEPVEFHFEFRGIEEAIATYIAREAGVAEVSHLRFNIQGVDEADRTIIGTWVRGSGFSGA